MAGHDLSPQSVTYDSSSSFGSELTGGYALAYNVMPTSGDWSVRCKAKHATSGSTTVFMSNTPLFWLGVMSGKLVANINGGTLTDTGTFMDGAEHDVHLDVVMSGTDAGIYLKRDGAVVASSVGVPTGLSGYEQAFVAGALNNSGAFAWGGGLSEAAVFSVADKNAYTPLTVPISPQAANLVALYNFDNNVLDSAGSVAGATKVLLSAAPLTGAVNVATTVTAVLDAALSAGQSATITFSSDVAGTFNPTTATITDTVQSVTSQFTPTATGTATLTGTASTVVGVGALTAGTKSYVVTAAVNNQLILGTGNVRWSPGNWNLAASSASSINPGAYGRIHFTGKSVAMQFDVTGLTAPFPQMTAVIDGRAPQNFTIAANVVLNMPTETSEAFAYGGHHLEFNIKSTTQQHDRWGAANAVKLTGIILDAGAVMTADVDLGNPHLLLSDSIGAGVRALNIIAGVSTDTDIDDVRAGWAWQVFKKLGVEFGIVSMGGIGFNTIGAGNVPAINDSVDFLYSGVARSWAMEWKAILVQLGTNDQASVTAAATQLYNHLITVTTRATQLISMTPFNGGHDSELTAAVAACSAPSRLTRYYPAGAFNTAHSYDNIHPEAAETVSSITPVAFAGLSAITQPRIPTGRTQRTVTLKLTVDGTAGRANLTGLHWEATDSVTGLITDKGTTSTDASGSISVPVLTSLAAGADLHNFYITNGNNVAAQNPAAWSWSGPATLS